MLFRSNSFGHGFNEMGGGVFAHLWTEDAIQVWFFPRNAIPGDIYAMNPNPANWGNPTANFPTQDSCSIGQHFQDHQLVIDTTLCGDWAGSAFTSAGCGPSCVDYVADPTNFKCKFQPTFVDHSAANFRATDAQWAINSIRVYQPAGSQ